MCCQIILAEKEIKLGVIVKRPDFFFRSILYLDNINPIFDYSKKYFSSVDEAESFCNFVVMNSSVYRKSTGCDVSEIFREKVGVKKTFTIILKFLVHKVFRIFYQMKNDDKVEQIVKTWIELNFHTYRERITQDTNSLCLVYPFPLSATRQIKYLALLRRLGINHSLYGLDYSIIDLIKFVCKRNILSLFQLEYYANIKSSSELLKYRELKEVLVMDDVDPFSNVVNKRFSLNGVRVECTLHGVGTYSPFYFADLVNVFNNAQAVYYRRFRPTLIIKTLFLPRKLNNSFRFDSIVFYSGVSVTTGKLNKEVEERVLSALYRLCKNYSVDLKIKRHPNFKGRFNSNIKEFDGLLDNKTLNVSLYSTSYYTVNVGQSALIETDEIPTTALFGADEAIIHETELDSIFNQG